MWINGVFLVIAILSLLRNGVYSSPVLSTTDDAHHGLEHGNYNASSAVDAKLIARTTEKRASEQRMRYSKEITTEYRTHVEYATPAHDTEPGGKRTHHSKKRTKEERTHAITEHGTVRGGKPTRHAKERTHAGHATREHSTEAGEKRTRHSKESTKESSRTKHKRGRNNNSKAKVNDVEKLRENDDRVGKNHETFKRKQQKRVRKVKKESRKEKVIQEDKSGRKEESVDDESNDDKDENSSESDDSLKDEEDFLEDDDLLKDPPEHRSKDGRLAPKVLSLLREALLEHPFKTWKYGARFDSMMDLGIHEAQLHQIIDNKWNRRMETKLEKVLRGEDIHLAIFGGSNAAGGGIQDEEGDTAGIFYRVVADWWYKTILPVTGSHLKVRLIAMGGTASDFFQYCYGNYLQDNVDVVFLELAVNDLKVLPPNVNLSLPIEQLTRQLLMYHTHPALLYVNLFNGRTYHQGCVNLDDFGQGLLSDVYKITTFNWRDAVCPKVSGNFRTPLSSCAVICHDGHHINLRGHAHISLMVINLFRDLLLDRIAKKHQSGRLGLFEDKHDLPRPVFIPRATNVVESPQCWTSVSPQKGAKIQIKNSMEVGVMENYGFDYLRDAKISHSKCNGQQRYCRRDTYSGWSGKDEGAYIQLSFTVPDRSGVTKRDKHMTRTRSVAFATRTCGQCGGADVWLDDDYMNRRYVQTKSIYAQTLIEVIGKRVDPGDHTISVRVVLHGEFTAVGVMVGPPDGPF